MFWRVEGTKHNDIRASGRVTVAYVAVRIALRFAGFFVSSSQQYVGVEPPMM